MNRILAPLVGALLAASCAAARLPRDMTEEQRRFLSEVRYLITPQERRVFLNTPGADRAARIEEFWSQRDPSPGTGPNEFKNEYYERIRQANRLFSEGGEPGWLEDRGRIYILLGPPWERVAYPRGETFYGKPTETWFYGFFPIVFTDSDWNGTYELDPQSVRQLSLINKAQMELKPRVEGRKGVLDFRVAAAPDGKGGAAVRIAVPYRNIWFTEHDGRLRTTLEVSLEVRDRSGRTAWELRKDHDIDITEDQLRSVVETDVVLDIPVSPAGGPGPYVLTAEVRNRADGVRVRKDLDLKL